MSKIKFVALGGLQEIGKNLYVIEVDERIFILDAGSKTPQTELHGIDLIVPNIKYLVENKEKIVGLFLTHAHEDHIGSVYHILKALPDIKVYASRFTLAVLADKLKNNGLNPSDYKLIQVTGRTQIPFDETLKVRFFKVCHNIPDCYGIDIYTADGNIIYTGNYNFDQNSHADYASMYRNLALFSKEKVLLLLSESLEANNSASRGTIVEFKARMQSIISEAPKRLVFSLYSSDILKIQQIIDIAVEYDKKIAVIGKKTQRLVNQAINLGYLQIPEDKNVNLKFIDENNTNEYDNLVVLVTGERHEPFFMLQRMAKKIDRLVHLREDDTVVVLTNPLLGTEKMSARTLDIVYHVTSRVFTFKNELLQPANASREEIKQMINILKPRYIIPVIGEYRHQFAMRTLAECIGYQDKDTIILDNGDIAEFIDGKYIGAPEEATVGELLLDGRAFGDIGDVVMKDRELLAEDGFIIISANINPRTKKIILGPEIVTKGFIYDNDPDQILLKIVQSFKLISLRFLDQRFINWSEYKQAIRSEISSLIYKTIKRNPIIIPVLISTDLDKDKEENKEPKKAE